MGNQFASTNCYKSLTHVQPNREKYNEISPLYIEEIDELIVVKPSIPKYKNEKHTKLINHLDQRKIKFQDKHFPTQTALGDEYSFIPKWKRISEVYPTFCIAQNNDYTFEYKYNEFSLAKDNFTSAMYKLMHYPTLLDKIFPTKTISKQGFYVLYFGLHGNYKERVEIVIDDFIPLDRKYQYLFGKPNKQMIWMILVQKALAKVVQSYNNIKNLTQQDIFQQITGVPLLNPNAIIFYEKYYLTSQKIQFPPEQSMFFKFTIDKPIKAAFFIWDNLSQLDGEHSLDYTPIVIELIHQEKQMRVKYQKDHRKNKIILSEINNFLKLEKGKYFIHVYNRSGFEKNLNMLVYASERLDIHLRKENHFENILNSVVFNCYRENHNKIKALHQFRDISIRFFWDGHRGILCLKNQSETSKIVQVKIQQMYEKQILFERFKDRKQVSEVCEPNKHIYVYFLRRKDREIGRFYKISLS